MSASAKGFFAMLVIFLLLSVILGYTGIERLQRHNHPPFFIIEGLFHEWGSIQLPSDGLLLFLNSTGGRWLLWTSVLVIPIACGILGFRLNRGLWGYAPPIGRPP